VIKRLLRSLIKPVGIGLWACVVALVSSYATATWQSGGSVAIELSGTALDGLEYRKPDPITVPMISDGRLRGYVVARISFTANARDLHEFPIDPQPFVLDETFRRIYTDGKVEFDQISKYNLEEIAGAIRTNVNERLGLELIKDVLFDALHYVDKDSLKTLDNRPRPG
jgi:hypothetical protein